MGKIVIDNSIVTPEIGKSSVKICPFNAIEFDGGTLSINSGCRMCKICVRKGPTGVFSFVEDTVAAPAIDKSQWVGVAVFVEHNHHEIHPVSLELIGKARELVTVTHHPVYAVLFTDDEAKMAPELLSYGVDKVFVYRHPDLSHFNVEIYANLMENFIDEIHPSVVLYGGTAVGRSFAPRVAARFKTGLTADCTILGMKENTDLIQNRPAFGGNIMAGIICPNNRPQMATVRYKIFKLPEKVLPHGKIVVMDTEGLSFKTGLRLLEVLPKPKDMDISEADVLIAVGRPFKTPDQFKLAQELADLLGGQIACSRPLIEAGLVDPRKQIGLSGRTVAPKLLITLGISGAVQFAAGMRGSEVVFSINSDANASIFDVAHYGIVGDVFVILPILIKRIKELKGMI